MSEYWKCIIGPIHRDKLPLGADFPMRRAVEEAFFQVTEEYPARISSGWGVTQEEADALSKLSIQMHIESNKVSR
jgi:hypothetical protein